MVIGSNSTVNGTITVYGGDTVTVDSTNVKLLSGNYNKIYGGGNNASVAGSTNLYVGGNVNSGISNITAHSQKYHVFGGSNGSSAAETNLVFADNASATMLYGGGSGAASTVTEKTNVTVSGGIMMGIYGGSNSGTCNETNITITGGNVEQVFGGNESSSMNGNTFVKVLGGTVTRRIFGGCYNEVSRDGLSIVWESDHHVTGATTVTIGENANITLDYNTDSYDDLGISATSRYKTAFNDEIATIIFENKNAESKYKSKLGITVDDWMADILLNFADPYDGDYIVLE